MRTLKFIVDGQIITKDPHCDFEGLVPGSAGYLKAEFAFSSEWNGTAKVAAFYSPMGREFTPKVLDDGKSCMIPADATKGGAFQVKVIGQRGDFEIGTNKILVNQNGGK